METDKNEHEINDIKLNLKVPIVILRDLKAVGTATSTRPSRTGRSCR